ncbi:MAG: transketolase [Betaproteobacteria bacterium]|nr:transketolase [Pseudomonadota bacterium]NBP33771.1 transketolase [Betaproteobacteria bacterium]NBP37948.1 transketolase [Betaproteobacteria bacterium]NBQ77738.1 transketolase [Betaproteobacteria bacterium]NBQ94157.1 transketolase [Betaproteobacteria bacterium]
MTTITPVQSRLHVIDKSHLKAMANALRILAMDAVQAANSGHPGMPMGMAEIALALWKGHLRHNPSNPQWVNRDRFVLSNGHGSMLLYGLLHLSGYDLRLEELKRFRQLHSRTPGHPEHGLTAGVETTTGPLGQGLANAVGMALAERLLAAAFNRDALPALVDHHTYAFVGDGCLMEGVSHEVCSLAGTWKLSKLIVLYDDNGISIDGDVRHWFSDDSAARFKAYGWRVIGPIDGHDTYAVDSALLEARSRTGPDQGPCLIICRTVIGAGAATKAGSAKTHGEPLGKDEIAATRAAMAWSGEAFEIPQSLRDSWDERAQGEQSEHQWRAVLEAYKAEDPELLALFQRRVSGVLPADWPQIAARAIDDAAARNAAGEKVATRKASQNVLQVLGPALSDLIGGSADLTGSNLTDFKACGALRVDAKGLAPGRHINYGVREFGMAAIMNGIALHGGFIPYGGTFLTFSDYARNALRMAALMRQRVIHVFTHDSIGLGEDGPTHQPIEHAASLRLIPNLDVWRPADAIETAIAWTSAVHRQQGPSALLLTRQAVPILALDAAQRIAASRGAYVCRDHHEAQASILASGSELGIALEAAELLAAGSIAVRVVSMPSSTVFDRQDLAWKEQVLGQHPRVAIEAGVPDGWWKYGCADVLGLSQFGESAPASQLYEYFGLTAKALAERVRYCVSTHQVSGRS